jgi:hypothetical protein
MHKLLRFVSSSFPALFLFTLVAFAQAASGQSTAQLSFETSAVVASGLTPGDSVAWFGVEYRVDAEFSGDITQHFDVGTVAADGTVRLDLTQPVADRSLWAAVDLGSGQYAVSGANGYQVSKPAQAAQLVAGNGTVSDAIFDQRPYLIGMVARPGTGAWSFAGGDGGPRDLDGAADGQLSFALNQLDPLAGSPAAPMQSAPGDLWFIVDPYAMELSVSVGGVAK